MTNQIMKDNKVVLMIIREFSKKKIVMLGIK